jgi:putative ABC transport system ATP-binding protein
MPPPNVPNSRLSAESAFPDAEALLHLAQLVDVIVKNEQARQAAEMARHMTAEPLEALVMAGGKCGLTLNPVRISIKDAVWLSHRSQPLVTLDKNGRWVVIRRHGYFKCRVSTPDKPMEVATLRRSELTHLLGVADSRELIDAALVHPSKPADVLGPPHARDAHGHHGHQNGHGGHGGHGMGPVRRYLKLLRPETADIYAIVIFSMFSGLLYLTLPLAVNALVSNVAFGSQSGPFQQALFVLGAVLFVCLAIAAFLSGLQHYLVEVIQRRLFIRLTADLSYRLPRVQAQAVDGVHAPELVNRFLDIVTMQKSTSLILLSGVNLVLSTLIGMTVLAFYHPFLLTFSLILVIALALIVTVLGRNAVHTSIRESRCKYSVIGWLEELARCPSLFKGPGGYDLAAGRADDLARDYLNARQAHFRILIRQIAALLTLEVIASAVLLTVGGWLVINQQLTLGQLVASEIIVTAIVSSIAKLGKQFEAWYDTMASVDKIGHLIDLDTEREDGDMPPPCDPSGVRIETTHMGFSYHHGPTVFEDLNFVIEPGERVALYGTQGSGTSTLLDLMHGLRFPTEGSILLSGADIRGWQLETLRERSMLLRASDIVSGTIADNLRLGRLCTATTEIHDALRRTGLLQRVLDLPDGLSTELIAGGLPLSSRQRVRLLFTRALLARPNLLLVDEVLDGLDCETRAELVNVLKDPFNGWTLIVATRDEAVAPLFDRVLRVAPLGIASDTKQEKQP